MFRSDRENYMELLNTMEELHGVIVEEKDPEKRLEYLTDCQNGALFIGNALEQDQSAFPELYEKTGDIVSGLEEYCEKIYETSQMEALPSEQMGVLNSIINMIRNQIEELPLRIKVAFFPYKAEMWDSLESIYLAAKADPKCDAKVVPVPYQEYQKETNTWENRYEGGRFGDTEVTFYGDYDPETERPDVAYIHYPYDDQNFVTRLREQYYSRNLKKAVRKLVYVPYYVTGGKMAREHLFLPVYEYADYIILQSQQMKDSCKGMPYYDKILPLGSPKLDSVIRKCKEGGKVPVEWAKFIGGRRTLMLNTSLNQFLADNELSLMKMEHIWDYFREHREIVLIWRPHPLLKSTIKSMRPELLERYEALEKRFVEDKIGIYDTTPDMENTVAIADGYIGSGASSVLTLFSVTGKPIFIMDANITGDICEEEQKMPEILGAAFAEDSLYLLPEGNNGLFRIAKDEIPVTDKDQGKKIELQKSHLLPGSSQYYNAFPMVVSYEDELYFAPAVDPIFLRYKSGEEHIKEIGHVEGNENVVYSGVIPTKDSLIYYSGQAFPMYEYQRKNGNWLIHEDWLSELWKDLVKPASISNVFGIAYNRNTNKIYITTAVCNRIMEVEAGKAGCKLWKVGSDQSKVVALTAGKEGLWLVDLNDDRVILLAPYGSLDKTETYQSFRVPETYRYQMPNYLTKWTGPYYVTQQYEVGHYLVLFSLLSEQILRLDTVTGKWDLIAEEFMKGAEKTNIFYHPKQSFTRVYSLCRKVEPFSEDGRFLVQKKADHRMAVIDVIDNTFVEFIPVYGENEFAELRNPQAGFGKIRETDTYCMRENRQFPMNYFLEQFIKHGYQYMKETQIDICRSVAANLDGTAGKRIHEAVLNS